MAMNDLTADQMDAGRLRLAEGSRNLADAFMPYERRRFIPYEIPLKPNRDDRESRARLVLPEDLTQAEAERLCAVIRALALPQPSSPASPPDSASTSSPSDGF